MLPNTAEVAERVVVLPNGQAITQIEVDLIGEILRAFGTV
jgi:dTDP-4-amino-4,6-dideoxygalactose transaminase